MAEEGRVELRRSARLALTEIQENKFEESTPSKTVSPDEQIIIQRGPRRKPITWSPVEQVTSPEGGSEGVEVEGPQVKRLCLNSKLRRRLILSPTKNSSELGSAIAAKLKSLSYLNYEFIRNFKDA